MSEKPSSASWLIKDNCMSCEGAFAIYYSNGAPLSATSNSLYELNITCAGRKLEECRLTQTDLGQLITLHDQVEMALSACRHEHGDALAAKASRIVRCFDFLQCARTAYSIPLRMAHYCSALEALFATTTVELSHRLSERVAHLLGTTRDARIAAYELVKEAYSLRSQVVHGAPLSKHLLSKAHTISSEMDTLLRTLLRTIMDDKQMLTLLSSPGDKIDRFFLNRLMSTDPALSN